MYKSNDQKLLYQIGEEHHPRPKKGLRLTENLSCCLEFLIMKLCFIVPIY